MKRLACALLAALILAQASVPSKATVAALGSVGALSVVGAFLMASGIYPYVTGDDTLQEWTDSALQGLIDYYNQQVEAEKRMFLTGADAIKGFLVGGVSATIAIAKSQWGLLRDFANWIISEFSLTDNQTDVSLGVSYPSLINERIAYLVEYVGLNGGYYYPDISLLTDYDFLSYNSDFSSPVRVSLSVLYNKVNFNGTSPITVSLYRSTVSSFSNALVFDSRGRGYLDSETETWTMDITEFPAGNPSIRSVLPPDITQEPVVGNVYNYTFDYAPESFSSVIADTTTVSVPSALPDDEEWGGLQIPEAVGGVTPEVVIESAIEGHLQPEVKPVSVKISPDITVNQDTGQVTQNPVIITGDDVPYSPDAFQAQSLQGKFPFSIPWDIYRVYSALNATPQRPEFHFSLTFPIVGTYELDIAIPDDIAPQVDAFAATFRNMILVLLCVWSLFKARDWIRFS